VVVAPITFAAVVIEMFECRPVVYVKYGNGADSNSSVRQLREVPYLIIRQTVDYIQMLKYILRLRDLIYPQKYE
jgi:hypothetical protein